MTETVRVRFAPSPTGHLHLGGARTALFNQLYARHQGGKFILRIEDTDRSRSTEEFIVSILEGLRWLGLDWDEGPFRQTDRFDIYRGYVERLLETGRAYHCYCSAEELEERRKLALAEGRPPKYDGRCRALKSPPSGIAPSVRFKMPQSGQTRINDLIKGEVVFDNAQLDDLIIMRSDGTPTYNFVVVVDDVDMDITHVIRGDDHLNNTPKQAHIYNALGHETPMFAHLPMILGPDKARLSKRHGAEPVLAYRDMGFLPDALVNYLARLGWSHGDQEVFSRPELIEHFALPAVGKSPAVFNPEKLLWLNSEYMRKAGPERLTGLVMPFLQPVGPDGAEGQTLEGVETAWLTRAVSTLIERCRTLKELSSALGYYISEDIAVEPEARKKFLTAKTLPYLKEIREALSGLEDFGKDGIEGVFMETAKRHGAKLGDIAQPVRVAVTGRTVSPGIFDVLEIIGKRKTLMRLESAIDSI